MQTQKDKLILDTNDNDTLKEYFSRKEVGEKCKITSMTVSLDSNDNGVVVLSVDPDEDITFTMPKGDKSSKAGDTADGAAARMYKDKSAADDESEEPTPDDEDTETPA